MLILGLDYGAKRIGLAVAESDDRVAVGAGTLTVRSFLEAIVAVSTAARERGVGRIVVGLPLLLNGKEGDQTAQTRKFANALGIQTHLPVAFQDERLTSRAAERSGASGGSVDERSAILLLQAYLERQYPLRKERP